MSNYKNNIRQKYLTVEELEELRRIKKESEDYYNDRNVDIEDF